MFIPSSLLHRWYPSSRHYIHRRKPKRATMNATGCGTGAGCRNLRTLEARLWNFFSLPKKSFATCFPIHPQCGHRMALLPRAGCRRVHFAALSAAPGHGEPAGTVGNVSLDDTRKVSDKINIPYHWRVVHISAPISVSRWKKDGTISHHDTVLVYSEAVNLCVTNYETVINIGSTATLLRQNGLRVVLFLLHIKPSLV